MDPFAGPISGDPSRLQQVFWNLLSNAIKFTPKGGKVQVLLERVNSDVKVSVIDTGEGIVPEFLPYVFDRFQQGDASTTRRHGGLGLGLAIVKQLVELHGGNVHATSAGIGQGATFIVRLPLIAVYSDADNEICQPRAPLGESQPFPELSLSNVQVLVVDDEIDARHVVKRFLEDGGSDGFDGRFCVRSNRTHPCAPARMCLFATSGCREKTATRLSGVCVSSRRKKRVPCPRSR